MAEGQPKAQLPRYEIKTDEQGRLRAEVSPGLFIGIRPLPIGHIRRKKENAHAYVVMDFPIEVDGHKGHMREREIRIIFSKEHKQYYIRWKQFKVTEKPGQHSNSNSWGKGWLDVCGPLSGETRARLETIILKLWAQIQGDDLEGKLPLGTLANVAGGEGLADLALELRNKAGGEAVGENANP